MLVISTGAGALIGWAVGSSMSVWEKVPVETAMYYDPDEGSIGVAFSFSF